MTFMSTGVRHAVGPFLKPIVADLGLDRASFSAVIALSLFLYGVFMPIAGMALDRFSVRVVTSVGTVVPVISLVLTAMVHNVWEFAVVYGVLVPLGLAGTGPVIASGVVARWFSKRRGTALSVLGSASMTGMSLLVPGVTWLIITTGWRTTYMLIAAGILVVVLPLCLWVVRDSPAPPRARRHLRRPGLRLRRLLPPPRQPRRDPRRGRVRRHHHGGHRLDDLGADRGHLRTLLRQLGLRPDLSRASDGLRPRLLARGLAVRDDGRLRGGVRAGVRIAGGRGQRRAQHLQGRATGLARGHRLGDEP